MHSFLTRIKSACFVWILFHNHKIILGTKKWRKSTYRYFLQILFEFLEAMHIYLRFALYYQLQSQNYLIGHLEPFEHIFANHFLLILTLQNAKQLARLQLRRQKRLEKILKKINSLPIPNLKKKTRRLPKEKGKTHAPDLIPNVKCVPEAKQINQTPRMMTPTRWNVIRPNRSNTQNLGIVCIKKPKNFKKHSE